MPRRFCRRSLCSLGRLAAVAAVHAALIGAAGAQVLAPAPSSDPDPQVLADAIQAEVAALRGKPFKTTVAAEKQAPEAFAEYLDAQMDELVPANVAANFDAIVRTVGLYRGDRELEIRSLMKSVMTSQAGAYYDPDKDTFFVLMEAPELMLGVIYSHELYHGLQDQYFDLNAYLFAAHEAHNDDEILARQAVVEGEATYIMTLWAMRKAALGVPLPRAVVAAAVNQQANMSFAEMRAAISQPVARAFAGDDVADAMMAAGELPLFVMESLIGAYLKGLAFVFAVEERGWSEVEKLYTEYPPASTEQILHPEKWFAREQPAKITWGSFDRAPFAGWELLEQNVLGEIQWRLVFAEHGFANLAAPAAAGWDGDRYAVLRHRDTRELLLLARTAWDNEAEAAEFLAAYERVQAVKRTARAVPSRLLREGTEVLIVEGGSEAELDGFVRFVRAAQKSRAAVPAR